MPITSLPTCRHCNAPAANPSSLAIFNDDNKLTGYRRGLCLGHRRRDLWDRQRPASANYDTGCPSCGHYCMGIVLNWETTTHSSRNIHYRPYFTDADIEEWSFPQDGTFAITWDYHIQYLAEDILAQMRRQDPPNNNALCSENGTLPANINDYWQNDNFQASRDSLYDSVTIRAYCENCERDLDCEFQ